MENVLTVWRFEEVVLRREIKSTFNLLPTGWICFAKPKCLHNVKINYYFGEKKVN